MELCSNGHTEIAYAKYGSRGCPICKEIKELQDELAELEDKFKIVSNAWDELDDKYKKLYDDCSKHAPHLVI